MTEPVTPQPAAPAGGSIYDLGYRRYEGPRLGRRHAVTALLTHTLRSCYGIGRGGRAKIAPFVLLGMAVIPAIIAVGVVALARQVGPGGGAIVEASPLRYETYYGIIATLVFLFCAAQAPELLGRDQRFQVLPLYFSRVLERTDYALAKLGGFVAAILILVLLPQLIIFTGLVLSGADVAEELADNLPKVVPIVGQGLVLAGLLGGLSLAISAFTPRRAYATAAIIAVFIIPPILVELVLDLGTPDIAAWLVLASPSDIVDATNAWFFGTSPEHPAVRSSRHPEELFIIVAGLWIAASVAILVRRYQRISA